jgi:hypothetical protein
MVTNGENALFSPRSMDVIADSTAPNDYVTVTSGIAFLDNVLIDVTENHTVDFNDASHYFGGSIVKESGYYYIVLEYQFTKSRPAPEAAVKIITPTEVSGGSFGATHLLLKVIQASTGPWSIDAFLDYNPSIPEDKRINTSEWASVENTLPTFSRSSDWGRIIYVRDEDAFYFGLYSDWETLQESGTRINIDTTASTGSLVYIDSNGEGKEAISTTEDTFAEAVVVDNTPNDGKVRAIGKVEDVLVESAISINTGDIIYLSSSEPGKITNVATNQRVGRALSSGSGTIDIYFIPGVTAGTTKKVRDTITAPGDWTASGGDYYYDVDTSELLLDYKEASVTLIDSSDDKEIEPGDIEFLDTSTIRIWMPVNTVSLVVIVLG